MNQYTNEDDAYNAYQKVIEEIALDLIEANSKYRSDLIKSLVVNRNVSFDTRRHYALKNAQNFFKLIDEIRSIHLKKIKDILVGTESFTYLAERLKKSTSMLELVSECRLNFKAITEQAEKLRLDFFQHKLVSPVETQLNCIASMSFADYMDPNFSFENLETWGIPFSLDYIKGIKS